MKKGLVLLAFGIFFCLAIMPVRADFQEFDSTYIWDAYVLNFTGSENNTNYGSNAQIRIETNVNIIYARSYVKLNLSGIPDGSTIDSAHIYYFQDVGVGGGSATELHHCENDTWQEDIITWNTQPCGINITHFFPYDVSELCNATAESSLNTGTAVNTQFEFDITEMLQRELDAGNENLTIYWTFTEREPVFPNQIYRYYHAKEASNINLRPSFNVSYSAPVDSYLGVFSATEYENGSTLCPLNFYTNDRIVANDVEIFNINNTANYNISNCCVDNGVWYSCRYYRLGDYSGDVNITIERTGYKDYEVIHNFATMGAFLNAYITPATYNDLFITVLNDTSLMENNVRLTLYFANNTIFESGEAWLVNPRWTTQGRTRYANLPADSYFIVAESDGHSRYISTIFALDDDFNLTIVMTPTDRRLRLRGAEGLNTTLQGRQMENYNFTLNFSGVVAPYRQFRIIIRRPNGDQTTIIRSTYENPYNFTLYGRDYFETGTNIVWAEYLDVISNEVYVQITEEGEAEITESPLVDFSPYGSGLAFLGVLFTPFSILFASLIGVSAMLEIRIRSGGTIFFGVILIGALAGGYFGLFPIWVSVGVMIICAYMIAKFTLKMI